MVLVEDTVIELNQGGRYGLLGTNGNMTIHLNMFNNILLTHNI
jgi:hypothetical protein